MNRFLMRSLVLLVGLAVPASFALAEGHGRGGREWKGKDRERQVGTERARENRRVDRRMDRREERRDARRENRRDWARDRAQHRPAGWDQGKKTGWNGANVPPGRANREAWRQDRDRRQDWRRHQPRASAATGSTATANSQTPVLTAQQRRDAWRQRVQQRRTPTVQPTVQPAAR